jgi:hypothetical protein
MIDPYVCSRKVGARSVRARLPLSLGGSGLTGPPGLPRVATHVRTPAEAAITAAFDDTNLSLRWQRKARLARVRFRHEEVNVNVLSIDVMWRTDARETVGP